MSAEANRESPTLTLDLMACSRHHWPGTGARFVRRSCLSRSYGMTLLISRDLVDESVGVLGRNYDAPNPC
jgi:hypothetical protein